MADHAHDDPSSLLRLLREDSHKFFQTHQHEGTTLEYKSSFECDLAMERCPLVKDDTGFLLNQALFQRILETIIASANTRGGVLVLGVSEEGKEIVDKEAKAFDAHEI